MENQNGVTPPLFVQEDGRFMPWQKDLYLGLVFKGNGGQQTIRVGDWKAVRQNMAKGNLKVELYNLATDVSESKDVAAQHPDVVNKLTQMMSEVRTPSVDFPLVPIDPRNSSK